MVDLACGIDEHTQVTGSSLLLSAYTSRQANPFHKVNPEGVS
jgi:hypothetical protein